MYKIEDLNFIEEIQKVMKSYNDANIPVVVVTNQAGLANGLYTVDDMLRFNQFMNEQLQEEYSAQLTHPTFARITQIICVVRVLRQNEPSLILQAAQEWNVDLSESFMYGDKESDEKAARLAGIGQYIMVEA